QRLHQHLDLHRPRRRAWDFAGAAQSTGVDVNPVSRRVAPRDPPPEAGFHRRPDHRGGPRPRPVPLSEWYAVDRGRESLRQPLPSQDWPGDSQDHQGRNGASMIAPDVSFSRAVELVSAVQPLVPTGRLIGLCWLMLIGLAGCGSGHQEPAMPSVAAAQSTGSISVSTGPVARLSEMVDAQLLPLEIRDAVRLDDGGIAYASGRELVIRIVSGDGDPAIAEVGRGGEGPG